MRTRRLLIGLVALAVVAVASPGVAGATGSPHPPPGPVTVASNLHNPRQIAVGPFGTLAVAEAGTGQVGASDTSIPCGEGPEGPACVGDTGSVTAIFGAWTHRPVATRVVKGLLSVAAPDGSAATGVDAVTFGPWGSLSGIMTAVPADLPPKLARQNGQVLRFTPWGPQPVADIASFSLSHLLPGNLPETDPYGILATRHGTYVADAAANTLLRVSNHGNISIVKAFEVRANDGYDGVPTSIAEHDGNLYVGQLSSLEPGLAKVTVLRPDGKVLKVYDGLSSVTGVAVAKNGDVYATELFTGEPFNSPGALVKISARTGARTVTELPAPGGVAVGGGSAYVSINSVSPTDGAVIRLPA
ncbi:ScyD/ScyE family protein [Dermatobacter hominis]|uniref:ScyD/ScyE family protein n=1 Tax=Dermatobacter hominis TaxID=2884263 RepID=UPI001D114DEC|nr:ScyD/ScyE family protein [Dermatobacter hominis]UDY35827.1 ScyD/ScyE family protein [Dermatobacter hominis]